MKIIDAHVHLVQCIAGTGAAGELRSCGQGRGMYADGSVCQLLPAAWNTDQATPERILQLMDDHNVERAVLLQGGYLGFQNLYSWQAQQKWPDRFLAAGAYDPYSRSRDGIVRHLFEELGLRVVKFEVSTGSGLMANHPVFPLDGEVMEREAAFAQEHGLVFVIDIGKLGSPSSQIQALRRLIRRHAGMKFVVCHLLAPKQNELEEMSAALDSLAGPNVWFDLASLQHNVRPDAPPYPVTRRFVARAVERVGAERLLFGTDTPQNLCSFRYEDLVDTIAQNRRKNLEGQFDLFGGTSGGQDTPPELHLKDIPEFSQREKMNMEKETTGLYLSGHPMDEYRGAARAVGAAPIGSILSDFSGENGPERFADGQKVVLAGIITSMKTKTTRNNSLMAYVTLEDDGGSMELLVFSRVLGEYGSIIREDQAVMVEGRLSVRDEKAPQLMCDRVRLLDQAAAEQERGPVLEGRPQGKKLFLRLPSQSDPRWRKIQLILLMFPGREPLKAKFEDSGIWSTPQPCQIHPLLVEELQTMLGSENVVIK